MYRLCAVVSCTIVLCSPLRLLMPSSSLFGLLFNYCSFFVSLLLFRVALSIFLVGCLSSELMSFQWEKFLSLTSFSYQFSYHFHFDLSGIRFDAEANQSHQYIIILLNNPANFQSIVIRCISIIFKLSAQSQFSDYFSHQINLFHSFCRFAWISLLFLHCLRAFASNSVEKKIEFMNLAISLWPQFLFFLFWSKWKLLIRLSIQFVITESIFPT